MIAFGDGWAGKGIFFFMVLASNALMATLVCVTASARMFYDGWSRNHSQSAARFGIPLPGASISRGSILDELIWRLPRVDHMTRALLVKDIKTFCRDTSQWSQFTIFFGLLGLYVLNLRNVSYDWNNEFWSVFVSFLNLGASSMTLATLTTRFVFPQISLEGKRLWIVGMAPYGLKRVLLEKFWLSSLGSATITVILMMVSSWMLRVPSWLALLFGATVILMSFALCGIAVGIGALFPNFGTGSTANRLDDNPAKIVSGFGGTFCFILSLVYLVLVIGAEGFPMYLRFSGARLSSNEQSYAVVGAWLFVSILSLIATTVPMTLALKRVEQMEM
jgi:ABC-2 type transport system permease protein